jgi:hypothetical protein
MMGKEESTSRREIKREAARCKLDLSNGRNQRTSRRDATASFSARDRKRPDRHFTKHALNRQRLSYREERFMQASHPVEIIHHMLASIEYESPQL